MVKGQLLFLYLFSLFLFAGFAHCEKDTSTCTDRSLLVEKFDTSPSQRFLSKHPLNQIFSRLQIYDLSLKEREDFRTIIASESEGFIGYHGGCSDYLLFQDLIRCVVQDILKIEVCEDFHFLRIPGTEALCFDSTASFLGAFGNQIDDTTPYVRQHILSLNIALFQSYDFPLELTPRYFLQNQPWTSPDYWKLLLDFVENIGVVREEFEAIIALGRLNLPHERGMLIQLYAIGNDPYTFIDRHIYAAYSGGKPFDNPKASYFISNSSIADFPQLRLVINNKHVLNPFSRFRMRRYDALTDLQRENYQTALRRSIQSLIVDEVKCKAARIHLLTLWNMTASSK